MKTLAILAIFLMTSKGSICSIQQAEGCFKDLATRVNHSSQNPEWMNFTDDLISTISEVNESTAVGVLLERLRTLERNVAYSFKSDNWNEWRRKFWMTMTDPNINITQNVTRFIISLLYMVRNLLPNAYKVERNEWKREEWAKNCSVLVDPLLQVAFYDELFLNVDDLLKQFGHDSLQSYKREATEVISTIKSAARELHHSSRLKSTVDVGFTTIGILSGIGLLLTPLTFGFSTLISASALAGTVISHTMEETQVIWDERKAKEVSEAAQSISHETLALITLLVNYDDSFDKLKSKLDSLGDSRAREYLEKAGLETYQKFRYRDINFGVQKIRKFTRPDFYNYISDAGTESGIDEAIGEFVVTDVLLPIVDRVGIVSHAFDAVTGIVEIIEGSEMATKFESLADTLTFAKEAILSVYDIVTEEEYEEQSIGTRYDNEGREETWHRLCFHGDMCIDLAILSYGVTGDQSEKVCRRFGQYLLSVDSQLMSDTVQMYISKFGKDTWFSTNSIYKDWAPSFPESVGECLIFSGYNSSSVKNVDCNETSRNAVVCA